MAVHKATVPRVEPATTSAEPNSPYAELYICRHAVLADRYPDIYGDGPAMDAVLEAARVVIAAVQERLRSAGGVGTTLDLRYGRALWDAHWQALAAVVGKTGQPSRAKEIQLLAAGGASPLSVCVGRRTRRFPEHVLRFNAPDMLDDPDHPGYVPFIPLGYGDGCGLVIYDTPLPRRLQRMPKRYCDRCAARAGNTLNAGLAKRALATLRRSRAM